MSSKQIVCDPACNQYDLTCMAVLAGVTSARQQSTPDKDMQSVHCAHKHGAPVMWHTRGWGASRPSITASSRYVHVSVCRSASARKMQPEASVCIALDRMHASCSGVAPHIPAAVKFHCASWLGGSGVASHLWYVLLDQVLYVRSLLGLPFP